MTGVQTCALPILVDPFPPDSGYIRRSYNYGHRVTDSTVGNHLGFITPTADPTLSTEYCTVFNIQPSFFLRIFPRTLPHYPNSRSLRHNFSKIQDLRPRGDVSSIPIMFINGTSPAIFWTSARRIRHNGKCGRAMSCHEP